MSPIAEPVFGGGSPEWSTQRRVLGLLRDELGYRYLGNWEVRAGNSNVEGAILGDWLRRCGTPEAVVNVALHRLHSEAHNQRDLYHNNRAVYSLLRYGVNVKTDPAAPADTIWLVDWEDPEANDFAVAEEVTLQGDHERRPDIVLYLNGLAVAVLELKNSRISVGDGIRQCLSSQQPMFHPWFWSTVQLVMAGNDSEGLRYGAIGTPEKHFLTWKEDVEDDARSKLDKYLLKLWRKDRLLELIRDFVLFDGGVKKLPRAHQYHGVKAAQAFVRKRQGGIVWHTQGSGKSLVMVLLARWILETNPHARVVVITDREELDEQIERTFTEAGERIARSGSGRELLGQLASPKPRLLCALVHKFGRRDGGDFAAFLADLQERPSAAVGEIFVFVDECHRTQGGRLYKLMRALLPNAVFLGFTGTPLLRRDRETSLELFGGYVHTYKFSEAVEDEVVLDLVYEARDIDQRLGSPQKIDAWFEAKTRGLNEWQKDELKKRWGTLQSVLSSRSRMERVVADIVFDFATRPRLSSQRGNAMLVASSIYEACKYFTLFEKTELKGKCAIVTSYDPHAGDVSTEETGANTDTDRQFLYNTYSELLQRVQPRPGMSRTETYEAEAKRLFRTEPANMKLLIVVDKLLTGFDAPPCTYLYIDKSMQDHGLFQAICRTNRLDGEDKDFGFVVDYKDLFRKVENAIAVYTSELDHSAPGPAPEVLLQDRLTRARERLEQALETLAHLCEPVEPPRGELEHIHYFCGNTEIPTDLVEREPRRAALYKAVASLVRAFANLADDLEAAGYGAAEAAALRERVKAAADLREIVKKASGESLDTKAYEADMRHLIDTYIEADEPRRISAFDGLSLTELIVKTGIAEAIAARLGALRGNRDAIAETIENNVRSRILKEHLHDPAFYESMSRLLDEIIAARREKALEYEEYLRRIAELVKQVEAGTASDTPAALDTPGKRALFHNLADVAEPTAGFDGDGRSSAALELALRLDAAIKRVRPDGWRGVRAREQVIKQALYEELHDEAEVERLFLVAKAQAEY